MYSNAAAAYRGDLSGYVFETSAWEQGLVADRAMPVVPVDFRTGQYPKFLKKESKLLKREVKARAPYGSFPRGDTSYVYDSYICQEWGFEQGVDDIINMEMGRFFQAEVVAARLARRKVLLDTEVRVAGALQAPSTYDTTTVSISYTITNLATFDAAQDIDISRDLLISRGEIPNTLVIPYSVWTRIKASTKFQQRARGIGLGSEAILNMTPEIAATVFAVDNVLIPRVAYDSAGDGVTFSSTNVWSNALLWLGFVSPAKSISDVLLGGAAYQFRWKQYGSDIQMSSYREERTKTDVIRAQQDTVEKTTNSAAGTLVGTQYA